jgi:2-methylcitrate dehydratase PrpD
MTPTGNILEFVAGVQWMDLPTAVRHQSKRCLLDALGSLIAGADTPVGRLMADFAVSQFGGDEATLLVDGRKTSATGAALANGFSGNALDIDDGYRMVKGHPGACALPPLLAAAEMADSVSGTDFLTAFVVGYEIGIRAGLIRHARYETYHASGSWGAIAGAAAVGRLLGMDRDLIRHAMGAAEYHAPICPMMKGIDRPSMGKDGIGWGTMVAVASALMARSGFTGIDPLFGDDPEPEWIDGLGNRFEMMKLYFKPYAACRWAQPAVRGVLEICAGEHIAPERVARIRVRTFDAATRLSCAPPRDTEEAQYSMAFPIAAALLDGEVGPRQVLPPRLFDADIVSLMARVETEVDPACEAAFPAQALAQVIVETDDGRELASGRMAAGWEPPDALPPDGELMKKFRWLVDPVLGADGGERLAQTVWGLEGESDARGVIHQSVRRKR